MNTKNATILSEKMKDVFKHSLSSYPRDKFIQLPQEHQRLVESTIIWVEDRVLAAGGVYAFAHTQETVTTLKKVFPAAKVSIRDSTMLHFYPNWNSDQRLPPSKKVDGEFFRVNGEEVTAKSPAMIINHLFTGYKPVSA